MYGLKFSYYSSTRVSIEKGFQVLGHVSILAIELELVLNRGSCMKISLKKRHQEPGVFLKLKSPFYHVLQQLVDSLIQC